MNDAIPYKSFGQLLKKIIDNRGKTCPTSTSGIPLIATNCIKNNSLYPVFENIRYVTENVYSSWFRGHPEQGDMIFVTKGTPGRVCWVPQPVSFCIAQDMVAIRANEDEIYPKYLFAVLRSKKIQEEIENLHVGSLIPHFKKGDFDDLKIPIVDRTTQEFIGNAYFNISQKIDLLNRQNKTIEAMAETLFRQWFIEEADESWEEVKLEDVTTRITDGSHFSPPTTEFGIPMASVKDMFDWGIDETSCRKISNENYEKLTRDDCRPLKNDILIAKDGSYLKHTFVVPEDLNIFVLSSIAIIRPNALYNPILLSIFLKLDTTKEQMRNIVTGAVIPRIVLKDFRKFPIILPPFEKQEEALVKIEPLIKKCQNNTRQIQTLEKLRDTLLPKLISGEVRVKLD